MTTEPSQAVEFEGLLLVGHGTRDAAGLAEARALADVLRARLPRVHVALAFLELSAPDMQAGAELLVRAGCRRVVVAPLLLFAAGHGLRDVPRFVACAAAQWPQVQFRMADVFNCHPSLLALSEARFAAAWEARAAPPEETVLLLVGRGSTEPAANAEMARFARLRWERWPRGWVETAFTAMTEPLLPRALAVVAALPQRTIVVQPHLLFRGELLERIGQQVREARCAWPQHDWVLAPHLGPDKRVAEAVTELAERVAPWE